MKNLLMNGLPYPRRMKKPSYYYPHAYATIASTCGTNSAVVPRELPPVAYTTSSAVWRACTSGWRGRCESDIPRNIYWFAHKAASPGAGLNVVGFDTRGRSIL